MILLVGGKKVEDTRRRTGRIDVCEDAGRKTVVNRGKDFRNKSKS